MGFDAVATQAEGRVWKHLGLRRDRYVLFNDGYIHQQGAIREKWPFPQPFPTS
ncbi:hypothetical protein [Saccharothrix syringae]|uniref:hypothetical protein n=1 Tax=Saccharothrix syringae TaxID=103733 RepID=UPI000A44EC79|nr:hypothetical protein [Saccharothrix syringae]